MQRSTISSAEIWRCGIPVSAAHFRTNCVTSGSGRACRWCGRDRKSTRLNSSHQIISYAVFCLKKKNLLLTVHNKNISEAVKTEDSYLFSRSIGVAQSVTHGLYRFDECVTGILQ